jgi:hypothetical protein
MTPTQINNRLTLTLDDNFQFILQKMKSSFPLLKDTDLVKMAIGGFYNQNSTLFARQPDPIEKKVIDGFIANPDLASYEDINAMEDDLGIKILKNLNSPEEIVAYNKQVIDTQNYVKSKAKQLEYVHN